MPESKFKVIFTWFKVMTVTNNQKWLKSSGDPALKQYVGNSLKFGNSCSKANKKYPSEQLLLSSIKTNHDFTFFNKNPHSFISYLAWKQKGIFRQNLDEMFVSHRDSYVEFSNLTSQMSIIYN